MDIVPGLEMLGQKERLEFKAYPGYIGNSRVTERGCVSKKKKWKQTPPFLVVAQIGSVLLVSPSMTYITSSMYRSPRTNSCLDYFSWAWGDFIEIINYSLGLVPISGERLFRVRRQNPTLRSCSQCHPEHASWKSCEVRRCRQGSPHLHLSFPHALHHHL